MNYSDLIAKIEQVTEGDIDTRYERQKLFDGSLTFLSSGLYRTVYQVEAYPDIVVKHGGSRANKDDAENFKSGLPIFPELYYNSSCFEYLLVQKADIVGKTEDDMVNMLRKAMPFLFDHENLLSMFDLKNLEKAIASEVDKTKSLASTIFFGMIGNSNNVTHSSEASINTLIYRLLGEYPEILSLEEKYKHLSFGEKKDELREFVSRHSRDHDRFIKLRRVLMQNETIKMFVDVARRKNIPTYEFFGPNIGYIEKRNQIVLIDSQSL